MEYPDNFGKKYSMNSIYAGKHWGIRSKDKENWKQKVVLCLTIQGINAKIYENPVQIKFSWNDNLDCDNHAYAGKMILDALKGIIIADDNKKHVYRVIHEYQEEFDGILIEIFE